MFDPLPDVWTPRLVADALLVAIRHLAGTAASDRPGGKASNWPDYFFTLEDILGWEPDPDEDERQPRRSITVQEVSRFEDALAWQSRFLKSHPGPARVLKWWLKSKLNGRPFRDVARRKRWSIRTAYRARDRALSLIAQGLEREGVPVWRD